MKRRALRAHANKRQLRLLSAEHGLRLDAYNVLCDASFLRAVALASCGPGDHTNNTNYVGSSSSKSGGVDRGPVQALRALVYETFAAATSHVAPGAGSTSASAPEKRAKDLSLSLFYLPETATALRRMFQQEEEQQQEKELTRGDIPSERQTGKLSEGEVKSKRKERIHHVVEMLLAGLECMEHSGVAAMRNEAKSIAQFLAAVAAGEEQPQGVQGKKNAHFFFVATQSHDVRRLLPGSAALIRLTTSPTALWIEKNSNAFHYDKSRMSASGDDIGKKRHHPEAALAASSLSGGRQLSPADLAFMRHLSVDLVPSANSVKRPRLETSVIATPTPLQEMNDKRTPNGSDVGITKKKTHFKKRGVSRPNPLSIKKKRVREVVRVDLGTPKKNK